jgi:hypothetical protein
MAGVAIALMQGPWMLSTVEVVSVLLVLILCIPAGVDIQGYSFGTNLTDIAAFSVVRAILVSSTYGYAVSSYIFRSVLGLVYTVLCSPQVPPFKGKNASFTERKCLLNGNLYTSIACFGNPVPVSSALASHQHACIAEITNVVDGRLQP